VSACEATWFEEEMAAWEAGQAERLRLATIALGNPRLRHPCVSGRPGRHATLMPSARPDCPAGHLQLTHFDEDGPTGHRYVEPTPEAVADALLWEYDCGVPK
jgi:hypothetical protein